MKVRGRRLRYGEEATLVEHLDELRSRIIRVLIVLAVAMAFTFAFHEHIIRWLNDALPADRRDHIITLGVAEPFTTSLTVSFYAALVIAFPFVLWQVWAFFAPAFTESQQRSAAALVVLAGALAIGGLAFGYFVVLPGALHFLTNYDSNLFNIQIRARDYYSFASTLLLAVVGIFEVPILVLGLVAVGVLTSNQLRRNRRWGYFIVAVLALALPGPDPVTTMFELIPMWIIFEASIWLAVYAERRSRRAAALAATELE
jgi:sec-independent protein translocase protein TatC